MRRSLALCSLLAVLLAAGAIPAQVGGRSPALCGVNDTPETGFQGDVPLADQQSGRAACAQSHGMLLSA